VVGDYRVVRLTAPLTARLQYRCCRLQSIVFDLIPLLSVHPPLHSLATSVFLCSRSP
jgi:hypothetical protein